MQITLVFQDGNTPDLKPGHNGYFFVRARSPHDNQVRVFGAFYLNAYPLHYEYGCDKCDNLAPEDCPAINGDGCPTTGWFSERCNENEDGFFERICGEVIGFAQQPAPIE